MKTRQDLRRIALGSLAAVAVVDAIARRRRPRPIAGVLDETAHLATGLLVLTALPRAEDAGFRRGLVAASVLLDVDHVPDMLGFWFLRPRGMRPRTHSVATLLALACSPRLDGALVGASAHLVRDLATGTNAVPLLWPFSKRPFTVPYGAYAAGVAVLAGLALVQSRTRLGASTPRVAPRKSTTDGAEAST
jgi:membrane-bound metal-dependent hydrolase YbcI (DUF457 family)